MIVKYLGGWEVYWDDPDFVEAYLLTHGVDKKGFGFFKKFQSGLELFLEGRKLVKCFKHDENGKELEVEQIELPLSSWENHKVFFLEKSPRGPHRIGGTIPKDFKLPHHPQMKTPFQYLGTIDGSEKYFSWLGINHFHITYPSYECCGGVYLDYSNPNEPVVIEPVSFDPAWYEPGMEKMSPIFSETRFSVTERWKLEDYENDQLLLCGIPLWYQSPNVPRNPITGKVMKYVCTINSDAEIKLSNYEENSGYIRNDFLIFADMGHLYVFFDPEAKIAHLQIQF